MWYSSYFGLCVVSMYFQFLIEDQSTEILVGHVMGKLKKTGKAKCEWADKIGQKLVLE